MVLVDTNILAFLLIEGDRTTKAQELYVLDSDWHSDEFILVEFSNILATYVRTGDLTAAKAMGLLREAEGLLSRSLGSVPHAAALATANRYRVSVYDARFLVAAESHGTRLITEDQSLRKAAGGLALSLDEGLAFARSRIRRDS